MRLSFADERMITEGRHWRDFRRAVAATAEELRRRNCKRGALATPDGYQFAVGLFALAAAGATIILPVNGQPGTLAALAGQCDLVLSEVRERGEGGWDGEIDADGTVLEFFTSGSTGTPKRIARTLGELAREIEVLETRWGQELGFEPVFATVSHQHIFGLTFRLLWPLLKGRPFTRFAHDLWEDLLADLPPRAVVIASPAHLSRLGGLTGHHQLSGLFTAGAPLPFEAAQQAKALFGRLPVEIYGSTETGAIATRRQETPDTPWTVFPGNEIGLGEDGHLRLRSPYVGKGDWTDLQDRVEAVQGGFRLLGRLDRIVKIAGKRIDLDEVESALQQAGGVAEAALLTLGSDDPTLAAVVVLSAAGQRELDEIGPFRLSRRLRAALAATQDPAGRPRRWRFVDALPRTGLDKLPHAALAALFEEAPAEPKVTALRQEGERAELDLEIPPDLRWFDGHFPDAPVLPGVVQLEWAMEFARRHLGLRQPAARLFQVKFKSVIQPNDRVTLKLTHDPKGPRLKFSYDREDGTCSSGSITLVPP